MKNIRRSSAEVILDEIREKGFVRVADAESIFKRVKKYTGIELDVCDYMLKFKDKKKFEITRLSELTIGDRFYLPRKRNKICEYSGIKKEGFEVTFFYFDHNNDLIRTRIDLKIVYLRNIND